jgi:hypothetical protein
VRIHALAGLYATAVARGQPALAARAALRRVTALRGLGRIPEAELALQDARPSPELGLLFEYDRLNLTGILHAMSGKTVTAERAFASSRALAAGFGCPVYEGRALMNLGNAAGLRGDPERALRWYAEAESVVARGGDPLGMAQLLGNQSVARMARRELGQAEENLSRAEALIANRYNPEIASWIAAQQAAVDEVRGRLGLAEGRLRRSREIAASGHARIREAIATVWLAGLVAQRRKLDEARSLLGAVGASDRVTEAHRAYSELTLAVAEGLGRNAALERLTALDDAAPLETRHRGWALERILRGRTR